MKMNIFNKGEICLSALDLKKGLRNQYVVNLKFWIWKIIDCVMFQPNFVSLQFESKPSIVERCSLSKRTNVFAEEHQRNIN